MSNIGRRKIQIPKNVTLTFDKKLNFLKIQGPLDNFNYKINEEIELIIEESYLKVKSPNKKIEGTQNAIITNLIIGVTKGFKVTLKLVGIGYRVTIENNTLLLKLGYSHDIKFTIPTDIQITSPKPNLIILFSTRKDYLNQVITKIKTLRKLDPYTGKGIFFENEEIKLKEGKKK